jgi:hypothetical protein
MTDSQENKSKPLKAPKPTGRVCGEMPGLPASTVAGLPTTRFSLPPRSPAGLPAILLGGRDAFRGNENKPLRDFSNRNSNDSRKRATLSEPTTSKFLIATKMHFSEEKAKRE